MFTEELDDLVKRMLALDNVDPEKSHSEADAMLIELINHLTVYASAEECAKITAITAAWERLTKYYA